MNTDSTLLYSVDKERLVSCLALSSGESLQHSAVLCRQGESCVLSCLMVNIDSTLLYSVDKESLVSCLALSCGEFDSTLLHSVDKESLVSCLVLW